MLGKTAIGILGLVLACMLGVGTASAADCFVNGVFPDNPPFYQNAFTVSGSTGVTIRGLDVTGASKEAIYLCGGLALRPGQPACLNNIDTTIENNCIHDNALPTAGKPQQSNGGIFIARNNSATVQNNEIRNNGRNGIQLESDQPGSPQDHIGIVGNVIRLNGYNGMLVGRVITPEVPKVNVTGNFICDNGTELARFGTTGGRYGLLYERSNYPPKLLDDNVVLTGNKFWANKGTLVAGKSSIDIGNWDLACTKDEDPNNGTTAGTTGVGTETKCDPQDITRPLPECPAP